RAVGETSATSATTCIVYINTDIAMGDTGVQHAILAQLATKYGGLYMAQNVAIRSTHQHSSAGSYLENLLPQLTVLGLIKQTYNCAHSSLVPGTLSLGNATVTGGNIDRSPTVYLANPTAERMLYNNPCDRGDQDKVMSLLSFGNRGILRFPVHGTSIYKTNTLVSSDNKGMVAYLYEASVKPNTMPGNQTFVASFAQANVNVHPPPLPSLGAFCESPSQPYDGQPCQANTSTCAGTVKDCHGRGPAFTLDPYGFHSNEVIVQVQVDAAKGLVNGGKLGGVSGSVRSMHVYLDVHRPAFRSHYITLANRTFALPNGTVAKICPAAMGFSFAGGTTDGPGSFDFVQGNNST
ncbi:Neutral/alkaline nonlysosomal ceramidase, partial [Mycena olivaceomarginata]